MPRNRLLLIRHGKDDRDYKPETLGNWFRDQCEASDVPGSLHGLRKAGATRPANAGATGWEMASCLAQTDTNHAAVYTKKGDLSRLADSGSAKTSKASLPNLPAKLDEGLGEADV